jgi:hypothetical protein
VKSMLSEWFTHSVMLCKCTWEYTGLELVTLNQIKLPTFKIGDLMSRIMSIEDLEALWLLLGTPLAGYLRVLMPLQNKKWPELQDILSPWDLCMEANKLCFLIVLPFPSVKRNRNVLQLYTKCTVQNLWGKFSTLTRKDDIAKKI